MYKILFMLVFQIVIIAGYYYFNNVLFLIINQFIISICLTLMDNAVSVNIHNIKSLNENFENLLKTIVVFQKKNRTTNNEWFGNDSDDE